MESSLFSILHAGLSSVLTPISDSPAAMYCFVHRFRAWLYATAASGYQLPGLIAVSGNSSFKRRLHPKSLDTANPSPQPDPQQVQRSPSSFGNAGLLVQPCCVFDILLHTPPMKQLTSVRISLDASLHIMATCQWAQPSCQGQPCSDPSSDAEALGTCSKLPVRYSAYSISHGSGHINWPWPPPFVTPQGHQCFHAIRSMSGFQIYDWPSTWQSWTSLERLTLHGWSAIMVPDWVMNLQRRRCLDLAWAQLTHLNVADVMQLPFLLQLNLGPVTDNLLNKVACACLPVLKRITYGFYSGGNQTMVGPHLASSVLQTVFVTHEFAPCHVQQWASIIDLDAHVVVTCYSRSVLSSSES